MMSGRSGWVEKGVPTDSGHEYEEEQDSIAVFMGTEPKRQIIKDWGKKLAHS
jgi:hypothetical protein